MIEKAIPITECSPNSMGVYGKTIAFIAMIFAGAERFSHLVYLGNKEVLAQIFGVKRLPDAATTLTRMFNKLKNRQDSRNGFPVTYGHIFRGLFPGDDSGGLAYFRLQRTCPVWGTGRGKEGL